MKRPLLIGFILAVLLLPVHILVPEPVSYQIAALLLSAIGGVYIGFAVSDGRWSSLAIELMGSSIYSVAALLGLLWNPLAIPVGIMAHALWDFAHLNNRFGARIPQWYIPMCAIVDVTVGGSLLLLYLFW